MVEFNEPYVEKASKKVVRERLNQGKGSQKQTIVVVIASWSSTLKDPLSGK